MTPIRKLDADTKRYLELLNQYGSCTRLGLLFLVDYWPVAFHRLQEQAALSPAGLRHVLKILILCLKPMVEGMTGARIRAGATIGPGLVVFNSFGVAIAANAVIGDNCTIYSGVLVASKANDRNDGAPVVGNDTVLMTGCKVLGGVKVGHDAVVGANSVVVSDVPAQTIATGVPAKGFRSIKRGSSGEMYAQN